MIPIFPKREFLLLGKAYGELGRILGHPDELFYAVEDQVSLWSPAQEIHHIAIVNREFFGKIEVLYRDREEEDIVRRGLPSVPAMIGLTLGTIPRGKVQAPARFEPPPEVMREEAAALFAESKREMASLAQRAGGLNELTGRIDMGPLGKLKALQILKLARVHTQFHLGVTKEIVRAREARQRR